jgi:hypothetical protein
MLIIEDPAPSGIEPPIIVECMKNMPKTASSANAPMIASAPIISLPAGEFIMILYFQNKADLTIDFLRRLIYQTACKKKQANTEC